LQDRAKPARHFSQSAIHVVSQLLVIGMHRVIAQYGQIDPERIVLDNTILERRAKAGSRGGAGRIMFFCSSSN
jgi:hypothetical protein